MSRKQQSSQHSVKPQEDKKKGKFSKWMKLGLGMLALSSFNSDAVIDRANLTEKEKVEFNTEDFNNFEKRKTEFRQDRRTYQVRQQSQQRSNFNNFSNQRTRQR